MSSRAVACYTEDVAERKTKKTDMDDRQGLMLRLPKELHTALRHLSIDRAQSLNTLITDVLAEWWSKQPERGRYGDRGSRARRGDPGDASG